MAGVGRQVIFYDQVGCGNTFLASNNTCPSPEQLTVDLYLRQIDALRDALGLDKVHLYGQGIGGMLALSYAADKQGTAGGVLSVTAASTASSYSQLMTDRRAALKGLGTAAEAALLAADDAGGMSAEAASALQQYTQQYVCRSPAATAPSPAGCARVAAQQRSRSVFDALAGGRYFSPAGALAGWDAQGLGLSSLQETPVLVTRGEFDEVAWASAQQLAGLLPNGQLAESAGAGSYQHIDAWEPHLTCIEVHLCAAEGSPIPKTA
ncbi:Alpha/Beta hydrolase protein [Scenedesmus sp. NREL 46B-D3]|nr:Alpha/Beta hydrolase protein [Scenedesmus sp. NREL 46B-D3]